MHPSGGGQPAFRLRRGLFRRIGFVEGYRLKNRYPHLIMRRIHEVEGRHDGRREFYDQIRDLHEGIFDAVIERMGYSVSL